MDLLWRAMMTQGQVCGCPFDCFFFNPQTLSVSICSRSGYVLGDVCWHRSIKDERDATRTSRMGIQTVRTLTGELRMKYGRTTDTPSVRTSRKNQASVIFP